MQSCKLSLLALLIIEFKIGIARNSNLIAFQMISKTKFLLREGCSRS